MSMSTAAPRDESTLRGLTRSLRSPLAMVGLGALLSGGGVAGVMNSLSAGTPPEQAAQIAALDKQVAVAVERQQQIMEALAEIRSDVKRVRKEHGVMAHTLLRLCLSVAPRRGGADPCGGSHLDSEEP